MYYSLPEVINSIINYYVSLITNDNYKSILKKELLLSSIISILILFIYRYLTHFEKIITVKERYIYGGGNHVGHVTDFVVVDTDNKNYVICDSIINWQFYSRELWTGLENGKTYHVKGHGIRFSFLSIIDFFPNIISIKEKTD